MSDSVAIIFRSGVTFKNLLSLFKSHSMSHLVVHAFPTHFEFKHYDSNKNCSILCQLYRDSIGYQYYTYYSDKPEIVFAVELAALVADTKKLTKKDGFQMIWKEGSKFLVTSPTSSNGESIKKITLLSEGSYNDVSESFKYVDTSELKPNAVEPHDKIVKTCNDLASKTSTNVILSAFDEGIEITTQNENSGSGFRDCWGITPPECTTNYVTNYDDLMIVVEHPDERARMTVQSGVFKALAKIGPVFADGMARVFITENSELVVETTIGAYGNLKIVYESTEQTE